MTAFRLRMFCVILALFSICAGHSAVIINEIHYDPYEKTELLEFIELHNTGSSSVNISGWQFTEGVSFTFPTNTSIPANGFVVVAENPAKLQAHFGASAFGPWQGVLQNDGETITLRDASGQVVDKVDYKLGFPWPTVTKRVSRSS